MLTSALLLLTLLMTPSVFAMENFQKPAQSQNESKKRSAALIKATQSHNDSADSKRAADKPEEETALDIRRTAKSPKANCVIFEEEGKKRFTSIDHLRNPCAEKEVESGEIQALVMSGWSTMSSAPPVKCDMRSISLFTRFFRPHAIPPLHIGY